MEKLLVLCLSILLTGSLGSSIHPLRNQKDNMFQEYLSLINESNQIISYIGIHLSSLTRDYELKISDTVSHANTFPILEDLQNAINKIDSQTPQEKKNCIDSALRMTILTTGELKKGMDDCVSEAKIVASQTQGLLKNLDGKATNLKIEILAGMHECLKDEENIKCLQDLLVVLKKNTEEIKKEVEDVKNDVFKLTENGIDGLNVCLKHIKEDLKLKSKIILNNLLQCIQQRSGIEESPNRLIFDFFKELLERIEKIIEIITDLPSFIEQIPNNIQEILSHLNVAIIARQIQKEIDNVISDGGKNAEKCRPEAEERLDNIVQNATNIVMSCRDRSHDAVNEIRDQINGLSDRAWTLVKDLNQQLLDCNLENILNPIGLVSCLELHYEEYKDRIFALQNDVNEAVFSIAQQADVVIKNLAECVNTVQIDTIRNGQQIIKDVEQCVLTIT